MKENCHLLLPEAFISLIVRSFPVSVSASLSKLPVFLTIKFRATKANLQRIWQTVCIVSCRMTVGRGSFKRKNVKIVIMIKRFKIMTLYFKMCKEYAFQSSICQIIVMLKSSVCVWESIWDVSKNTLLVFLDATSKKLPKQKHVGAVSCICH